MPILKGEAMKLKKLPPGARECIEEDLAIYGDPFPLRGFKVHPPADQQGVIRFRKRLVYCENCDDSWWMTRQDQKCECGFDPHDY